MTRENNKATRVTIKLYASRLKNLAGHFKGTSDPYAVVTLLAGGPNELPKVLGKTEVIKNSLSPAWTTQFEADYMFGKEIRINVGIFDEVRKTGKHRTMGSAQFELGEVLGARGNVKAKKLKNGGTLFCRVTAAAEIDYGTFHLQLRGLDLDRNNGALFRGKPDPFFVLNSQVTQGGGNRVWLPAYRSEVVSIQTGPADWKALDIPIEKICGGDRDQAIQVEVFDFEKSGKHKPLGKFQTSLNGFIGANHHGQGLELEHQGKTGGKIVVVEAIAPGGMASVPSTPVRVAASMPPTMSNPSAFSTTVASSCPPLSGPLVRPTPIQPSMSAYPISHSESASSLPPPMPPPMFDVSDGPVFDSLDDIETLSLNPLPQEISKDSTTPQAPRKIPKFVDYLSGGLEISLSVAIDFTGSNGDPRKPGTLHYISPDGQQLNDYEKALTAVGSIVARYDSDQRFPVLGFGAKYKNQIQHCFQVGKSAESVGVQGMLASYRSVFSTGLTMSGPTVFAEVIQHVASKAQQKWDQNRGLGKQSYEILLILTDGAVTDVEQTRSAINFASTAPLSIIIVGVGDDDFSSMRFLDHANEQDHATRDIVQFVEFSRYRNDRQALTRETLDGIPEQIVDFFYKSKGIMPLAAVNGSEIDIFEEDYNSEHDVDLIMSVGDDGSVRLADHHQATWDATSYGKAALFLPPAISPPPFNPSSSTIYGSAHQSIGSAPSIYAPLPSAYSAARDSIPSQPVQSAAYVSSTSSSYSSQPLSPVRQPNLTPYVRNPASSLSPPRRPQNDWNSRSSHK